MSSSLEHTNVHLHFTPTYSSWLNQVELWFAKIERDVIARGVFTSVPDLKRKLMRYIRQYNKQPKPVKWKYFDPSRRITSTSSRMDPNKKIKDTKHRALEQEKSKRILRP